MTRRLSALRCWCGKRFAADSDERVKRLFLAHAEKFHAQLNGGSTRILPEATDGNADSPIPKNAGE